MAKPTTARSEKLELKRTGTLNPHPSSVSDALFKENPFFDPNDLLQVRYEMLRRHSVEGASIVDVAAKFGVSRPTVYQAQAAFQQAGLSGLLPKQRGPKERHKLSAEVIEYVRALRAADPGLTTVACRPSRSGEVWDHDSPPQSGAGDGEQKKTAQSSVRSRFRREPWRPTRDSVDKRSNRMDEENTSKVAEYSCAEAWQRGHNSGPRLVSVRPPESHSPSEPDTPALDSFGSELVRLLAGLILSTRQESFLHA